MKVKEIEKTGRQAVKILRQSKLNRGFPFMINSNMLPPNQCYLEHPDGSIQLVTLSRKKNDFEVIKELDAEEGNLLRKKYKLC
jgi:hypothetical protein